MKSAIKLSLVTLLVLIINTLSNAQSTSVFDANYFDKDNTAPPIKIGKGFHINDIYKQTRSCFNTESINPNLLTPQQIGGKKTNIRLFYTTTNQEFNDFKSRGASGKISFLNLFEMNGKKLESYAIHSVDDEERLIFTANVDFGIYSFDNDPTLTIEAKNLIDQNKLQEFVKMYGTHYVSGIRKESRISVILTKTTSMIETIADSNSSISTNMKIPYKGSGSFEVENGNWTNQKLQENTFSVSVEINGPAIEQSVIQSQINNILNGNVNDKSLAISEIIGSAIKNISDPAQSLITQYYYSPFSLYGLDGIFWDDKKQTQLIKLNEAIISVYSIKSRFNQQFSQYEKELLANNLRLTGVTEDLIGGVTVFYDEILRKNGMLNQDADKFLKALELRYINCSDVYCSSNSSCCDNEAYISTVYNYNFEKIFEKEVSYIRQRTAYAVSETIKPECEKKKQGLVTIKNVSINPYNIYLGNNFIETLPGNSTKTFYVNKGLYVYKAIQKSGFLLYPTENTRYANITDVCQELVLKIGIP